MFFCDKKGAFVLFPNKVFLHVAKQIQSEYLYIRVLFVLYILKQLHKVYLCERKMGYLTNPREAEGLLAVVA